MSGEGGGVSDAEVAALLAAYEDQRTETGRRRLVRHGHGPARGILTGIGPVVVRRPKVRDRGGAGLRTAPRPTGPRIRVPPLTPKCGDGLERRPPDGTAARSPNPRRAKCETPASRFAAASAMALPVLALTYLHMRRPRLEAFACGCQLDRARFPRRQADPRGRTEFDPVRQVHLDPNPRNGLGRRVGHGPGEGFGRGVETKLKTDAAARLLSGFRYPVTNPGLPRLLSVLALGTVFVTRVVPFPLVALVPRRRFRFGLATR